MGLVKKQGLQNTVISYFGSALGFLNKVLLLPKLLLIEQVGLVNVLASFSLLYAQISGFGVYNVIIRFYPHYKDTNKAGFLRLILKWFLVGFLLLTLLFLVFESIAREHLFEKAPLLQEYFYWILPLSFLVLFFEVLDSYSRALLKSVYSSFLKDFVLRAVFTLVIVCYYFEWIDFSLFIAFFVASYLVVIFLLLNYLYKQGALVLGEKSNEPIVYQSILKFGFYVFLAESSSLLVSTIDSIMLADYSGLVDTGVYTTMIFLTSAFLIPYRSLSKIATPIVPQLWSKNDTEGIQKLYSQFSNSAFFVCSSLFLLILANINWLFVLLPPAYSKGIFVFVVVGLARLIDVLYGINTVILVNSAKYKTDLLFAVLLIIITVTTNYFFIPEWGMEGAVVASFISIVSINVVRGIYLKRVFGFSLVNKKIGLQLFFLGLTFALLYFIEIHQLVLLTLIHNFLIVGCFLLPVFLFDLAPEIKSSMLKTIKKRLNDRTKQ